jgi:FkbM family methyltransferase
MTLDSKSEELAPESIGDIRTFLCLVRKMGFIPRGIVDVGANRGNWTRMAREVFPKIPALLIEPQDEMEEPLTIYAQQNSPSVYLKLGIGDENRKSIQSIWPDLEGSSFLPKAEVELLKANVQRHTDGVTLDSVLNRKECLAFYRT